MPGCSLNVLVFFAGVSLWGYEGLEGSLALLGNCFSTFGRFASRCSVLPPRWVITKSSRCLVTLHFYGLSQDLLGRPIQPPPFELSMACVLGPWISFRIVTLCTASSILSPCGALQTALREAPSGALCRCFR